jgi:hypothetical protein
LRCPTFFVGVFLKKAMGTEVDFMTKTSGEYMPRKKLGLKPQTCNYIHRNCAANKSLANPLPPLSLFFQNSFRPEVDFMTKVEGLKKSL